MLFAPEYPRRQPFRRGRRYRVLQDFTPLEGETFHAGDILIYRRSGHSIYDSMDGYFFIEAGPPRRWRRWDISTFDDIGVWATLFEMLPRQRGWWHPWLLTLAAVLLIAIALAAQPLPQGLGSFASSVPGERHAPCPLPEPATGRMREPMP